ncbi:MAG: DUF1302 domain-containing protein [Candidatus Omnitrophica bacterium]|nr:DUF1302 domain-containing protein [Candidatus Omnitrophota bacterium]
MNLTFSSKQKFLHTCIMVAVGFFLLTTDAHAFRFQHNEVSGFIDTTISSGASLRLQERDPALIGRANGGTAYTVDGDNGNRNFSKGTLISNTNKAINDMGLSYQNYSAFVRLSYFFDPVNRYKKELTPYQRENAGQGFDLLDAYVEGKFEPWGKKLNVRVGKQVLNWGESIFIPGGLNSLNSLDVGKLQVPGAEFREAIVPSPMISDSFQLTPRLSLSNYYIFKYDRTKLEECGTFFSTTDIGCEGGTGNSTGGYGQVAEGTSSQLTRRLKDDRPSNHGQYGAALRYLSPELNDSEFGIYFENFHNHVPVVSGVSSTPGAQPFLFFQYLENLQVYGFTASTNVGSVAIQGEYSYRPDYPLQIETGEVFAAAQYFPSAQVAAAKAPGNIIRGYRKLPVNQLQASMIKAFGHNNPFKAQEWVVAGEAAVIYVSHFPDKRDLRFDGPATNLAAYSGVGSPALQTSGWADRLSWGYVLSSSTTYQKVIKNIDLTPRVAFSHNVEGTTPSPLSQFVADRMSATIGINVLYLNQWSAEISYTNYFGASFRNALNDRDFASLIVKHWF